jgi:hypothetical protein
VTSKTRKAMKWATMLMVAITAGCTSFSDLTHMEKSFRADAVVVGYAKRSTVESAPGKVGFKVERSLKGMLKRGDVITVNYRSPREPLFKRRRPELLVKMLPWHEEAIDQPITLYLRPTKRSEWKYMGCDRSLVLFAEMTAKEKPFVFGKPMDFVLLIKNPGKTPIKLYDAYRSKKWKFIFTSKSGGVPHVAMYSALGDRSHRPAVVIESGGRTKLNLGVGGGAWVFYSHAQPQRDKPQEPVAALPQGAYTVTTSYSDHFGWTTCSTDCTAWHGLILAGPLDVSVVKGK